MRCCSGFTCWCALPALLLLGVRAPVSVRWTMHMRCCSGCTCWCALPALPIPWCEGAIVHALDYTYVLLLWVYLLVRPPGLAIC